MRKVLLLSLGVGAALVAALFVGAAVATTGAPVFYDARYRTLATTGPGAYEAGTQDSAGDAQGAPIDDPVQAAPDEPPPPDATKVPADPAPPSSSPPPNSPPSTLPPSAPPPSNRPPSPDSDREASDDIDADSGAPGTEPTPEEKEQWLAFQQVVRDCMAKGGHEYLYWEWWNLGLDTSNRFPAMPPDLTPEEVAAWELALNGDTGTGDAYRWQDAGCWGRAVHTTGGSR